MNKIIINGRLTADPEIKTFGDGTTFCNFTVAVDRGYKTKDGNRESDFFDCKITRVGAALLEKYFKKGDGILLEGAMERRSYEKDGEKRYIWELNVKNIYFPAGKKGDSAPTIVETNEGGELPF